MCYQRVAAAPSPLGEGWPKAGVCRTSRFDNVAANKNKGRGVLHRQAIAKVSPRQAVNIKTQVSSLHFPLHPPYACRTFADAPGGNLSALDHIVYQFDSLGHNLRVILAAVVRQA